MLSLGPWCRSSTGAVSGWFFRSPYDSLEVSFKRQGASVIRQGKLGTSPFVIASGEVRILIDGKPIRDLCKNAYFGERSLLFCENRSATIEAVSSTAQLWSIEKSDFLPLVSEKMCQWGGVARAAHPFWHCVRHQVSQENAWPSSKRIGL